MGQKDLQAIIAENRVKEMEARKTLLLCQANILAIEIEIQKEAENQRVNGAPVKTEVPAKVEEEVEDESEKVSKAASAKAKKAAAAKAKKEADEKAAAEEAAKLAAEESNDDEDCDWEDDEETSEDSEEAAPPKTIEEARVVLMAFTKKRSKQEAMDIMEKRFGTKALKSMDDAQRGVLVSTLETLLLSK